MTSTRTWAGRILTGLVTVFLLFDGAVKVVAPAFAAAHSGQLGIPDDLVFPIGLIELTCLAVYLIPQTSALGAVLLTGFLGGAISTLARGRPAAWLHAVSDLRRGARLGRSVPARQPPAGAGPVRPLGVSISGDPVRREIRSRSKDRQRRTRTR